MTALAAAPRVHPLLGMLDARLAAILGDVERAQGDDALRTVTMIVETMLLAPDTSVLGPLRSRVVDFAAGWARRGVLSDLLFCESKQVYAVAALTYVASNHPDFDPGWIAPMRRLIASGHGFRTELPAVARLASAALFRRAGIPDGRTGNAIRDYGALLSRRLLRPRDDEFDVLTLVLVAQLRALGEIGRDAGVVHYCEGLIATGLRRDDDAWLPVAAFVARMFGRLDPYLECVVHAHVSRRVDAGVLFDEAKPRGVTDDMMLRRSGNAIALRSAIAALLFLEDSSGA
ncbi:MAG: hypothetical protein NVS4B13_02920 [Candidatus Elarobacter sp.]